MIDGDERGASSQRLFISHAAFRRITRFVSASTQTSASKPNIRKRMASCAALSDSSVARSRSYRARSLIGYTHKKAENEHGPTFQ